MTNRQRKQQGKSKKSQLRGTVQQPQLKQTQPQTVHQPYSAKRISLIISILLILVALFWIIASVLNAPSTVYNTFYAFFAALGVILVWFQLTSPSSSTEQISNNNKAKNVRELFLIYLWKNRKVRAGAILVILLLILSTAGIFSIFRCTFVSGSTPQKTLISFCNALIQRDFQRAYDQFSSSVKQKENNSNWSAKASASGYGQVIGCDVLNPKDDGDLGSGIIHYTYPLGNGVDIYYSLRNECGEWKITSSNSGFPTS